MCSDGLSGPVEDDEIGTILGCLAPKEAAQALIDLANLRGGPDNIIVIIARVTGPDLAQQGPEQRRPRSRSDPRPVPPLLWALLGGSALGAVGLGAVGYFLAAAVCAVGFLATAVAVLARRYGADSSNYEFDVQPKGKGPYTACNCHADGRFVERLVDITHQLRDAAIQEDWSVDWNRFNAHHDRAVSAAMASDYTRAVREHCHAISFMMSELRRQRGREPSG